MTDYARQIEQIKAAQSLDEIHAIARSFSAQATGEGGILYTGKVGTVDAMVITQELAHKTGLPIINDVSRAHFLSGQPVEISFCDTAKDRELEEGRDVFLGCHTRPGKRLPRDFTDEIQWQATLELDCRIVEKR